MKVNIKRDFDGKVSTSVCHKLNELCGQQWTMVGIREMLNSTDKCHLNEIGRKVMLDKSKVNYMNANYILVVPQKFITLTGKQLYVWLYRENTNKSFGKINLGIDDIFEYEVVKNFHTMTKGVKPLSNRLRP